MEKQSDTRLWEIDILRGFALILMVTYHFLYDLNEFFNYDIAYNEGVFYLLGKSAAILFILIAGVSCSFSKNNTLRGVKLIIWGSVIFLVTYIAVPGSNIIFGILHFLGTCLLLYPFFRNLSPYILVAGGAAVIVAGEFTAQIPVSQNWLAPLGFWGPSFTSVDYFPLIPWLGVFWLGIAVSKLVYQRKKSLTGEPGNFFRPLTIVGRHTLVIYLLHQPFILAALYLIIDPQGLLDILGKFTATL